MGSVQRKKMAVQRKTKIKEDKLRGQARKPITQFDIPNGGHTKQEQKRWDFLELVEPKAQINPLLMVLIQANTTDRRST